VSNLTLTGTLNEGPNVAQDGNFPSGTTNLPFTLNQGSASKPSACSTGAKVRQLNSPFAFVALSGVGATDDVTQADTIYIRVSTSGFKVRLTFADGTTPVLPINGLFIIEPDAGAGLYVTKVELQGAGQVEYFASGRL
jgi:hypothetical protein